MRAKAEPQGPPDTTVNLRMQTSARDLIDLAAATVGKNRTDFMVEAARREAEAVLLDRCFFSLSEEDFRAFIAALDQPPTDNPRLRQLLRTRAPWEKRAMPTRKKLWSGLRPPEPISEAHDLSDFESGEPASPPGTSP